MVNAGDYSHVEQTAPDSLAKKARLLPSLASWMLQFQRLSQLPSQSHEKHFHVSLLKRQVLCCPDSFSVFM